MKREIDLVEQGMLIVIYSIQVQLNYVMSVDDNIYVCP